MTEQTPFCLYCQQTSNEVPLVKLFYKGKEIYICPQHLPILIHHPEQVEDKLEAI